MFRSYDHLPPEDGHTIETCSGIELNIQNCIALDGNPEPDLIHIEGSKLLPQ
jgi:hypothetical protein